jgi:hypothetical protein
MYKGDKEPAGTVGEFINNRGAVLQIVSSDLPLTAGKGEIRLASFAR